MTYLLNKNQAAGIDFIADFLNAFRRAAARVCEQTGRQ